MVIASIISTLAFFGAFGAYGQSFSAFIALGVAFILSPIIAIATKGKYYIARESALAIGTRADLACTCCGYEYERADMTNCPYHKGDICSLCCSLESGCHDMCKGADFEHGLLHG